MEFVDQCLKKVLDACLIADAALIITADHGNIEQMINLKTGDIDKDHTTNPVPFLLAANEFKFKNSYSRGLMSLSSRVPAGAVSDVAPTVLGLFGIKKPEEMTGVDLIEEIDDIPQGPQTYPTAKN